MNFNQLIKRSIDVVAATALLLLAMPWLLLVALLILILEGRPVFYISRRYITPESAIPVLKFRTMKKDALSPKYRLKERFMRGGYLDIPRNCEVYTPIGSILERLQIVELPQLLNVLFHGMTLMGNRPLPFENVQLLKVNPSWKARFESPAGITGIAQVVGKLNLEPEERLALEATYSEVYRHGRLLYCDVMIAWYTAQVIVLGTNVTLEQASGLLRSCLPKRQAYRATAAGV